LVFTQHHLNTFKRHLWFHPQNQLSKQTKLTYYLLLFLICIVLLFVLFFTFVCAMCVTISIRCIKHSKCIVAHTRKSIISFWVLWLLIELNIEVYEITIIPIYIIFSLKDELLTPFSKIQKRIFSNIRDHLQHTQHLLVFIKQYLSSVIFGTFVSYFLYSNVYS
jgi:hypothetical protein